MRAGLHQWSFEATTCERAERGYPD